MMQMYISNDWALTETQVRLAEKYGFTALAITVDAQVLVLEEIQKCSGSENSTRIERYCWPIGPIDDLGNHKKDTQFEQVEDCIEGHMHPKDAVIALDYCDAIWVQTMVVATRRISSTINILPLIKAAVGDRIPLLIDGGVRTGNDIYKCLALGPAMF
ncbi:uncharacterized protein LOC116244990 [Nymphaea colorata]|nr:uncharacterized protein LOC116244990 [Nymphaea colorata]